MSPPEVDLSRITTLLLDADGTLFPSEEPAFDASANVVNRALADLGSPVSFTGPQLRHAATGRNFRSILIDLAREHRLNLPAEVLDSWVAEEVVVVTEHLRRTLRPDPSVGEALRTLNRGYKLAVVSSSALRRLAACFTATDLDRRIPPADRFSAQDSLPVPSSKPDPAVYAWATRVLGVEPEHALAIEDAASGVASAKGAGIPVIGTVAFVPPEERAARAEELVAAGAMDVSHSWQDLGAMLAGSRSDKQEVCAP